MAAVTSPITPRSLPNRLLPPRALLLPDFLLLAAMAPKQGKTSKKAGKSAAAKKKTGPPAPLPASRVNADGLVKAQHLVAARSNEHGATNIRLSNLGRSLREGYYPVFLHCLYAGLVPPFSPFLLAILEAYQIQLLHLHPNSILILAIFAYLCEAYIGIRPSVALFRHFYSLRSSASGEQTGCISFRISDVGAKEYIPMAWDGEEAVT